jgi:probable addiction module antidote protein
MDPKEKELRSRTLPFDAARYLKTPEDMASYLMVALEDGDPQVVAAALGDIARAKGISQLARETGLTRETLYSAFSPDGNPRLTTFLKVVHALGLRLDARALA